MEKYKLNIAKGFDPRTQKQIGFWAAQLEYQLKKLKYAVKDLTVKQLEWQQKPGMNTVGMLLAHNALVEVWWVCVAPNAIQWNPDGKKLVTKILGFEDDGMPLAPDGKHPSYLKKYSAEKYLSVMAKARRAILKEMKSWRDKDLDKFYTLKHGKQQAKFTRAWTLYHVLEHFCTHHGQILLLKHLMQNDGVLKKKKTK